MRFKNGQSDDESAPAVEVEVEDTPPLPRDVCRPHASYEYGSRKPGNL